MKKLVPYKSKRNPPWHHPFFSNNFLETLKGNKLHYNHKSKNCQDKLLAMLDKKNT